MILLFIILFQVNALPLIGVKVNGELLMDQG